jgi:hypothetical protein
MDSILFTSAVSESACSEENLGRTETVKTRFDLNKDGSLVEHVVLETHDKPNDTLKSEFSQITRGSAQS